MDYVLFKKAFCLIKKKEHLTTEGVSKIANIRASKNGGAPDSFKVVFAHITPVTRVEIKPTIFQNPS